MIETRAKWGGMILDTAARFTDVFVQSSEEYRPGIFEILKRDSTSQAQENYTQSTGFDRVHLREEGDNAKQLIRYKGFDTKMVVKSYSGTVELTEESMADNDFRNQLSEVAEMARAIQSSKDEGGVQILNGGFDNTDELVRGYYINWYGDTAPLFSTIHPSAVPGGSSQSNTSSIGIVLTDDNLEIAKIALELQLTDDGNPIKMTGRQKLVVPKALEKTGMVILESERKADTDYNNINVYRGRMDLVTTKFLDEINGGSSTAWYLVDDAMSKLYYTSREEPTIKMAESTKNRVWDFTSHARWGLSVRDWRGVYASKGDAQAYSA